MEQQLSLQPVAFVLKVYEVAGEELVFLPR